MSQHDAVGAGAYHQLDVARLYNVLKLGIDNPLLRWAGSNLFPIYIYMRVPMLIIEQTHPELIAAQPFLFILISLTVTIVIARCYRYWQVKM